MEIEQSVTGEGAGSATVGKPVDPKVAGKYDGETSDIQSENGEGFKERFGSIVKKPDTLQRSTFSMARKSVFGS